MSMYDALPRATTQVEPTPPSTLRGKMQSLVDPIAAKVEEVQGWVIAQGMNVMSFGAVDGGSAATNTTALNAARAAITATGKPGHVIIPVGVDLPVTPDGVLGASNVTFTGGGTLSTTQITAGALITFPAGSVDCGVDGVVFKSPNDHIVGVYIKSAASSMSKNITIKNNRCIEARLVQTNDLTIAYGSHSTHLTTGTVTRNVSIANNIGVRTGANLTNLAFILVWYTIGGEVIGNRIDGYGYGIQWWGGDADPGIDGAIANERKCGELTIAGNRASNMLDVLSGGGGIWGSMGFDITVAGNTVKECADIGIDFEGCLNCTASGNTVTNAANGAITTFFYNRNIVFTGNTCRRSTAGIMARVQNNFSTQDNQGATFVGNTFESSVGISYVALETAQRSVFRSNTLRNVYVTSEVNNQRNVTIESNSLEFSIVAGTALYGINVGLNNLGGRAIVRGNTVESRVVQPAGSRAIRSSQADPTTNVQEFIDDNILFGWANAIETIWDGANAAITTRTFIRRNTIDVAATIVNTRGAASLATGVAATVVKEGNRYADGTAVP